MTDIFKDGNEEFEYWRKELSLVENTQETCPGCGNTLAYYTSLYDYRIVVEYCNSCNKVETRNIKPHFKEEDICPYCYKLVRYLTYDEFYEQYLMCDDSKCENKAHIICIKVDKKVDKVWFCEKHKKNNTIEAPLYNYTDKYIKQGIRRLLENYPGIFTPALACYMLEGSKGEMTLQMLDNLKVYEYAILKRFGYNKIRRVLNDLIKDGIVIVDSSNRIEWNKDKK